MMSEDFDYFDHDADIGVVGRGTSLEQAFEAAAAAMFAIMADPAAVRPQATVRVAFAETDPELALVTWLNGLLAEARTRGLALCRFRLHRDGERWTGEADGQPWHAGIVPGTEVKGATLTGLHVGRVGHNIEARCVVDV